MREPSVFREPVEPWLEPIEFPARVRCTLRDEDGRPLKGALVTVLCATGAFRCDGMTSGQGTFSARIPAGEGIVFAGGREHALVRRDFDLEVDRELILDLTCPRIQKAGFQIEDHAGKALGGWHLEARATDAHSTPIGRDDSHESGFAALSIPPGVPARLFMRWSVMGNVPKALLPDVVIHDADTQTLRLAQDMTAGRLRFTILSPGSLPGSCEARAWRTDSDEGLHVPRSKADADDEVGAARARFRTPEIVPGEYVIEYGSPQTGWQRAGPFVVQPGAELDAGELVLEPPAQVVLRVGDASTPPTVSVRTRVQGMIFEGRAESKGDPARLRLRPGEWTIWAVSREASSSSTLIAPRSIEIAPGQTLEIHPMEPDLPR